MPKLLGFIRIQYDECSLTRSLRVSACHQQSFDSQEILYCSVAVSPLLGMIQQNRIKWGWGLSVWGRTLPPYPIHTSTPAVQDWDSQNVPHPFLLNASQHDKRHVKLSVIGLNELEGKQLVTFWTFVWIGIWFVIESGGVMMYFWTKSDERFWHLSHFVQQDNRHIFTSLLWSLKRKYNRQKKKSKLRLKPITSLAKGS